MSFLFLVYLVNAQTKIEATYAILVYGFKNLRTYQGAKIKMLIVSR